MGYSTSTSGTWRKIHKNIKEKKIQKGHEYLDKAPQVQLLVQDWLLVQIPCAFEWMRITFPSSNYWLCPWASQVAQVELHGDVWMKPVVAELLSGVYVYISLKEGSAETK